MSSQSDALPYIGRPAASALAEIGVAKASQLRDYTEKDLLALHGVGPKAIWLLKEANIELKEESYTKNSPKPMV